MSKFLVRAVGNGLKFDLYAANGEAVASSEVYRARAACLSGIASIRKNAPAAPVEDLTAPGGEAFKNPKFQLYTDRAGAFRFRLRARNGAVIAFSGAYTTRAACLSGIESVRRNALSAQTVLDGRIC